MKASWQERDQGDRITEVRRMTRALGNEVREVTGSQIMKCK